MSDSPSSDSEPTAAPEPIEREELEVDVLFVGGGCGSLAGAIRLMQCIQAHNNSGAEPKLAEPNIAVIEKGSEIGAHIFSGAVMNPVALDELLPGWRADAPYEAEVSEERVSFLTETWGFNFPVPPPNMQNHGNFVVSASRITRYLGKKAEELGVQIFAGFPAVDVLFDGDRVIGVQTGDKGIDATGKRKSNFEAGILLKAKTTIFGEGVLGHCTRIIVRRLNLDAGKSPPQFETGVKEIIKLPEGKGRPGFVMHTLGYPLDKDTLGGTFIYGFKDDYLVVGLVVSADYGDPAIDPHYMLQQFKKQPRVAELIEGGKVEAYGGKALTAGGWSTMPQIYCDGAMFIGECAQIMDIARLKGLHLAMKSGMLAAETAFEALIEGDSSSALLRRYKDRVDSSYIKTEMWAARNFHQSFDKGLYLGILRSGVGMVLGSVGQRPGHHDHKGLKSVAVATEGGSLEPLEDRRRVDIPTWTSKLDDVYMSGVLHEEDQPSHLKVADTEICHTRCTEEFGNPCLRFCPAQVYEMVPDTEREGGGLKLQVNFSNCVHCKTCDIKDPYQIITWTPPEGGGGPNYKMT